jgi:alkylhydroperoxidase family enzyme
MMDYAAKICSNPPAVTEADVDRLRADGLSDQQITDIALAAVARNFISRFFHALGASPDPELQQQEPELWDYLQGWGKRF